MFKLSESDQENEDKTDDRSQTVVTTTDGFIPYSTETKMAVLAYRKLCRHIENTVLHPKLYSIEYTFEIDSQSNQEILVAHLSGLFSQSTKIVINRLLTHLRGTFDTVLKGLEWNKDGAHIAKVQRKLGSQKDAIYKWEGDAADTEEKQFLKYTGSFWAEGGTTLALLKQFMRLQFNELKNFINLGLHHNISLLVIMPIALTKYLMITKIERKVIKKVSIDSQKKARRAFAEVDQVYQKGDVINCHFDSFTLLHPFHKPFPSVFSYHSSMMVLRNYNDYFAGEITHAYLNSYQDYEREILIEPSARMRVLEIKDKAPYKRQIENDIEKCKKIYVEILKNPELIVSNDSAADLSLFIEKDSKPSNYHVQISLSSAPSFFNKKTGCALVGGILFGGSAVLFLLTFHIGVAITPCIFLAASTFMGGYLGYLAGENISNNNQASRLSPA